MENQIILKDAHIPNIKSLEVYLKAGGYEGIRKILSQGQEWGRQEVEKSNFRERKIAGKHICDLWKQNSKSNLKLVLTCFESGPGCFKENYLLANHPHLIIEGILILAYLLNLHEATIVIKGELVKEYRDFCNLLEECTKEGFLGTNIFGSTFSFSLLAIRSGGGVAEQDESILISLLKGKKAVPFVESTKDEFYVIQQIETICSLPWIMINGGEKFKQLGNDYSGGTKLVGLSGDIKNPGVYEVSLGSSLHDIILKNGNGVANEKAIKVVIASGKELNFISVCELEKVKIEFSLENCSIIVLDEDRCLRDCLEWVVEHYNGESCGDCTPCREGIFWANQIMAKEYLQDFPTDDLNQIREISRNINFSAKCNFAGWFSRSIDSLLKIEQTSET